MNSVKITYLILHTFCELFFLVLAVAAPIWITPGFYWWTAFGILMMFLASYGGSSRVNKWDGMGEI